MRLFWKAVLPFLILGIWISFCFLLYRQNSLNIRFGDEEDNFLLGKYALQGEKLYSDLFSHHQPLAYVLSAGVQAATSPTSIIPLVLHHREFLWVWALFWTGLGVAYFGWPVIFFSLCYEIPKKFLFGDQFLSESLVIYPMLFLLFSVLVTAKKNRPHLWYFFLGLAFSTSALLLLPIWPVIGPMFLWIIISERKNFKKLLKFALLGGVIPIILTLPFVDLGKYFYNSFYINNVYYLRFGVSANEGLSLWAFITPLAALTSKLPTNEILTLSRVFSILFIGNLVASLARRKFSLCFLSILFLGLANLRYTPPGMVFYQGFHTLPWFAFLLAFSLTLSWQNLSIFRSKFLKGLGVLVLSALVVFSVYICRKEMFHKTALVDNFHVHYSQSFDIATAINIIGIPTDTLFATPGDWLVYWQAKVKHASYMLNYYGWMPNVPSIKREVDGLFEKNTPTFFYCNNDCLAIGMGPKLSGYQELFKDGIQTGLFVKPEKLRNLTEEQKRQLKYFRFTYKGDNLVIQ